MPSDRKKKKAAQAKERRRNGVDTKPSNAENEVKAEETVPVSNRACTGVITSHPQSRDIQIESLTLLFHGHELLMDTELHLNFGRCGIYHPSSVHLSYLCRRYGLIGPNGCGKSTLLAALAAQEVAIPEHIDVYYLSRECPASDVTALEEVMNVDDERTRLEADSEALALMDSTPEVEQRLQDVLDRSDPFISMIYLSVVMYSV